MVPGYPLAMTNALRLKIAIENTEFSHEKLWIFHSYVQCLPAGKSSCSYGFPMGFSMLLPFSYGFSFGFPMVFL